MLKLAQCSERLGIRRFCFLTRLTQHTRQVSKVPLSIVQDQKSQRGTKHFFIHGDGVQGFGLDTRIEERGAREGHESSKSLLDYSSK